MKVVILCGGKGTRMGNEELPKALFSVGDKTILWHIMSIYARHGFKDFILCLGYQGDKIRDHFSKTKNWKIKFVDTGLDTNTGGRINKIKDFIKDDCFLATYGDGLADVNIRELIDFHRSHKKTATLTAVRPYSQFGIVGIDAHTNAVTHFKEKPILDHWINGGFFVFNKDIFRCIRYDDILEKDTFGRLVKRRNLSAYKHSGFWECMDTYKDNLHLNQLWSAGKAPWAIWKEKKNG